MNRLELKEWIAKEIENHGLSIEFACFADKKHAMAVMGSKLLIDTAWFESIDLNNVELVEKIKAAIKTNILQHGLVSDSNFNLSIEEKIRLFNL